MAKKGPKKSQYFLDPWLWKIWTKSRQKKIKEFKLTKRWILLEISK